MMKRSAWTSTNYRERHLRNKDGKIIAKIYLVLGLDKDLWAGVIYPAKRGGKRIEMGYTPYPECAEMMVNWGIRAGIQGGG